MHRRTLLKALTAAPLLGACAARGPITRPPPGTSFQHPATEEELQALVRQARARGGQLRVRGAMHSHGAAIFTDDDSRNLNVQLDRYNRVLEWNDAKLQVTVQSGIHLGEDPHDPAATWETSLNLQLQRRGWALPCLGGITHQTVGGFLSTGSAGGSLKYDVGAAVVRLRIIAGDGTAHDLAPNPAEPDDELNNPFYAAGVSMGLLGVLSTVTFQCVPTYNVTGMSVSAAVGAAGAPCDPFADGDKGLAQWLAKTDYSRLMMWPQRGVERVQYWSGNRAAPVAGEQLTPHSTISSFLQPMVAGLYDEVDRTPPPYSEAMCRRLRNTINDFVADEANEFRDVWFKAIPIDNAISDLHMPTEFTDVFMDLSRTHEVMERLKTFWAGDEGMNRTGPYITEVYASMKSRFWMSPTFQRDSIRVDLLWFKTGQTRPDKIFYPQYWELLKEFDLRFHWGKHLSPGNSSTGVAYRRKTQGAEQWDKFLALREKFDPDQVFVTAYWREHFGIAPKRA